MEFKQGHSGRWPNLTFFEIKITTRLSKPKELFKQLRLCLRPRYTESFQYLVVNLITILFIFNRALIFLYLLHRQLLVPTSNHKEQNQGTKDKSGMDTWPGAHGCPSSLWPEPSLPVTLQLLVLRMGAHCPGAAPAAPWYRDTHMQGTQNTGPVWPWRSHAMSRL